MNDSYMPECYSSCWTWRSSNTFNGSLCRENIPVIKVYKFFWVDAQLKTLLYPQLRVQLNGFATVWTRMCSTTLSRRTNILGLWYLEMLFLALVVRRREHWQVLPPSGTPAHPSIWTLRWFGSGMDTHVCVKVRMWGSHMNGYGCIWSLNPGTP